MSTLPLNYNQYTMKNILLATIVFSLMSCSSQKQLETTDIPFEIGQSTFQKWSGGKEESGTGAELKIVISEAMNDMTVEKVYFRGRAMDCELKTEEGMTSIIATYKSKDVSNDDDGKKMQEAFELQPTEAVLAYQKADGKVKYVKVEGIKEKAPVLYKSRPRN